MSSLESQAALPSELGSGLVGADYTVFAGRQNNVLVYKSILGSASLFGTDIQQAQDIAEFRRTECAIPNSSECDGKLNDALNTRKARMLILGAAGAVAGRAGPAARRLYSNPSTKISAAVAEEVRTARIANNASRDEDLTTGSAKAERASATAEQQVSLNPEGSQVRNENGKFINTLPDVPDPTNLERAELRQTSDGQWKIFGSGEPRTPKGTYNFVTQDGKVYVGTGDQFQGHIDVARGNPVDYAGQITFGSGKTTKGALNSWSNASGHYLPEPVKPGWEDSVKLPFDKFKASKHD